MKESKASPTKALPDKPRSRTKDAQSPIIRNYLVGYNILSTFGWSYVAFSTLAHLFGATAFSRVAPTPASSTATSALRSILGLIPYFRTSVPITAQVQAQLPSFLLPVFNRATSTFTAVGLQTALIQSLAILEVFHSLLGWVRSPVPTTAAQVTSRYIIVWLIAEQYESARTNPLYASMVLAWSITEIIRYSFYAANLLGYEFRWLLWLRYNTFFVLYPLGAGSEAALIFSTLPSVTPPRPGSSWIKKSWNAWDYGRALLFLIWWPALYVLYGHMIRQRKKVLGGSGALSKSKTM